MKRIVPLALLFSSMLAADDAVPSAETPLAELPYTPSLDPGSMDRSIDPCVDFYQYSCGGWLADNPIPADRSSFSVYGKAYETNRRYLWGLLDSLASAPPGSPRDPAEAKTGDYYAACMDETAVEAAGLDPLAPALKAVASIADLETLARVVGLQQRGIAGGSLVFGFAVEPDLEDAAVAIPWLVAGGLGLPDRDQYFDQGERAKELRAAYVDHLAVSFELLGAGAEEARARAHGIMSIEAALAAHRLTRVERRDTRNLSHRMSLEEAQALMPSFPLRVYLDALGAGDVTVVNVTEPEFFREIERLLHVKSLDDWRDYLEWHLLRSGADYLSSEAAEASFGFYGRVLQGSETQAPRWKRCVGWVDADLPDSLGQVFVARTFPPEVKADVETMVTGIQGVMARRIGSLDWMGPETKARALEKLEAMRNKIGYPDTWRDDGPLRIERDDFFGNVVRSRAIALDRQLAKVDRPVDPNEWGMSPPTVNAYYDPSRNDMNFPAGVLLPPLFDPSIDDAPNYGDTGGTIGHELVHGFDDSGSRFDAAGNLADWWTPEDRAAFEERVACVKDQFAAYPVIDDITINSDLTAGEDVADIAGTDLAWEAWRDATREKTLEARDGLTPEQRFFVGFAQWSCGHQRPEALRLRAKTDPHSPPRWRINGVVTNLPAFSEAFACKAGDPMVKEEVCRIW